MRHERSELQAERNEVLDDRQVLGNGTQGGRVRVRLARKGPQAEVKPRTPRGEEGKEIVGSWWLVDGIERPCHSSAKYDIIRDIP